MAEAPSLSTKDLFLLMVGLFKLQNPPQTPATAKDYWFNDKGLLRDTEWNLPWLLSPEDAWNKVIYRDFLIANIIDNLAGHKNSFGAISEPMLASMDLLSKEFTARMPKATEEIKQLLISKGGYECSLITALGVGLSKQKIEGKDTYLLGAGIRRRTAVVHKNLDSRTALQADIEFFVPFYLIPGTGLPVFDGAQSICAGIALSRANGNPIIEEDDWKDVAAARFNFRIPFSARMSPASHRNDYELETRFQTPMIQAQKLDWVKDGAKAPDWQEFDDWKDFVKSFCSSTDGGELLNAPVGPVLLGTISDPSSIKDILKSKRPKIKEDFASAKDELAETAKLLHGLFKDWKVPEESEDPEKVTPPSSLRKVGGLLTSLGLLNGKSGKYSPKSLAGLTVWDVLNRLLAELDGFPLYVSGVDPKKDKDTSIVVALASQADELNKLKQYFGLAGLVTNIPIKTVSDKDTATKDDANETKLVIGEDSFTKDGSILIHDDEDEQEETEDGVEPIEEKEEKEEKPEKKSTVEIRLHLGKWFDGETLEDNWFRRLLPTEPSEKSAWNRRVPIPGVRILPFQRVQKDNDSARFSMALRGDILSAGFDFTGTTKDGLTFLQLKKGPLAYFGLGGIETRIALLLSPDRIAFGLGIKLKDLRLSFGPKEKKKEEKEEESGNEILDGLQDLLADDWEVVPAPKARDDSPKTRLTAKKKDKFSISVGYLSPLSAGSHGTLDIQLYDEKGNAGKTVLIPIERRYRAVYLKHIGIGLKGVENVELSKGLSDSAQLTVALTGGLRFPIFELGFIGATVSFPLANPTKGQFSLEGLDVSLKLGPAIVSGSFLRSGVEYAGSLTIDLPKFSIGAVGFYGSIPVGDSLSDKNVVAALRVGLVHQKLREELAKNKIVPALHNPIRPGFGIGEWELLTDDKRRFVIAEISGEVHILSQDKTLFVFGVLSAATGGGVRIGPIEFTAIALGFGLNRRVEIPSIEGVAEFPLVQMVMGEGGYQEEDESADIRKQLGEAVENPVSLLEDMAEALPAEQGQYVICGGVRFTIASTVDCFGLIIVQFGNEFEFALLGLARFRHPRDLSAKPICYIEMQILMSIKPSEGCFKLQALLTDNSWIINKDCKLTGGFALFVWFAGEHKDDFVITLGGYHPRFRRPEHYPIVPRLGLNWQVNENLSIKGGSYFAVTPSCCMLGAKLEATFQSGRISAWFTAYLDVILAWSPLHFEVDIGISLRVEAALFITALKVTIAATIQIWGPPTGGLAHIDLTVISFDIDFGASRAEAKPKLMESWEKFCSSFLNMGDVAGMVIDKPLAASPIKPTLTSGRNNLNILPDLQRAKPAPKGDNAIWRVRCDELELSAAATIPVTTLNVGHVKTNSPADGIRERGSTGKSLLVKNPVVLTNDGLFTRKFAGKLGVQPMGKKLESALNITIVRDDVTESVNLKGWTIEEETGSLPAAMWDADKPKGKGQPEPSAKLISNCITGVRRLKPPIGQRGNRAELSNVGWQPLEEGRVVKSGESQSVPSATRSRNIQSVVAGSQATRKQVASALSAIGFNLSWKPTEAKVLFRDLQADPLAGAVATAV